jgi:protein-tyrosine-phosphatase
MAAALLNRKARGRVHVRSAGSTPGDEIQKNVRSVMSEVGLDLSQEFPKPLSSELVHAADVIITMGCGDACPVFPGKRYLDWDLPDPSDRSLAEVRAIRDDIDSRVTALLTDLI